MATLTSPFSAGSYGGVSLTKPAIKQPFSGRVVPILGSNLTDRKGTVSNFADLTKANTILAINANADPKSPMYRTLEDYNKAKAAHESFQAGLGDQPPELPSFTTIKTVKQPEIATATGNLLGKQQQQSNQTSTAFQSFLDEARNVAAQSKEQLAKDQAAFDTTKIDTQLPAINRSYRTGQDAITTDIGQSNKDYAAQTADTIARLNAENSRYETAAQAVADRAVAAAQARNSLYQLTSGTPTSGSGNLTNRYMRAVADINIPLQRELSERRYSQVANIEQPLARENYMNDAALLARRSGLESDYAGREGDTARYLNDLHMRVAGMSRAQAQDYLASLKLPFEISQRIIAGDIANLSGIQALDERANYYTVATPFDESRLPVVTTPGYSMPSRSYVGGGGYIPAAVAASPSPAVAGAPSARTYNGYVPNALTQATWDRAGYSGGLYDANNGRAIQYSPNALTQRQWELSGPRRY